MSLIAQFHHKNFDSFTGIWDVLSNQEVVDFVRIRIAQKMEPEQVCKSIIVYMFMYR